MPVPVPHTADTSISVIKAKHPGHVDHPCPPVFQHLSHNPPVPWNGQAPSVLPSAQSKLHRIWEEPALRNTTRQENHSGAYFKQAGHMERIGSIGSILGFATPSPAVNHTLVPSLSRMGYVHDEESGADYDDPTMDDYLEEDSDWNSPEHADMEAEGGHFEVDGFGCYDDEDHLCIGEYSPVYDEPSPPLDTSFGPDSSPLGPLTPFGEFVDRAVANVGPHAVINESSWTGDRVPASCGQGCYPVASQCQCPPTRAYAYDAGHAQLPAPPPVVTPSADGAFKKLSEPLSEWLATYVWRVCTTGMDLPPAFIKASRYTQSYPPMPPRQLAGLVRSLLHSTLLQPSAIFLSLWYITRLPVSFGAVGSWAEKTPAASFRQELTGHVVDISDVATRELQVSYRVIVLGFMLANKWLDDHTFSNKTWHTISNIPISALNKLEVLALDLFAYDLSIAPGTWTAWLAHVMEYHSASSLGHLQPISRPSNNPYVIVRKALDELVQNPPAAGRCGSKGCDCRPPQPVFLGLAERLTAKKEEEEARAQIEDIDLDEDGPLRKEYLPKRRGSGNGSIHSYPPGEGSSSQGVRDGNPNTLPPPARWSPENDEPIIRNRLNNMAQYMAPHPSSHTLRPPPAPQPAHYQPWHSTTVYAPVYAFEHLSCYPPPAYYSSDYRARLEPPPSYPGGPSSYGHFGPDVQQSRYSYSDMRVTAREFEPVNTMEAHWTSSSKVPEHAYPAPYGAPFHVSSGLYRQH